MQLVCNNRSNVLFYQLLPITILVYSSSEFILKTRDSTISFGLRIVPQHGLYLQLKYNTKMYNVHVRREAGFNNPMFKDHVIDILLLAYLFVKWLFRIYRLNASSLQSWIQAFMIFIISM
jgi:hypothetical protein